MKSNPTQIIFGIVFICLCLVLITGIIGFNFFQNRPPSSLSASGYYVRGSTIYYHPGFGIGEPFEITEDSQFAYYQNNIIQNVDASILPPDVQVNNCTETELYTNP